MTKLAEGEIPGADCVKVNGSTFRLHVDPARTRVDATVFTKPTDKPTDIPKDIPELNVKKTKDNRVSYERHGSLGLKFAEAYAKRIASSVTNWSQKKADQIWQTVKDVQRATKINVNGLVLDRTSITGQSDQQAADTIGKAFKDRFSGETDLVTLLTSISNQTAFNLRNVGVSDVVGMDKYDKMAKFIGHRKGSSQWIQDVNIGEFMDGSVSVEFKRTFNPERVTFDPNAAGDPPKVTDGSVEETYSLHITKLGDEANHEGDNIAHVGDSYFRIDVDPVVSRTDVSVTANAK